MSGNQEKSSCKSQNRRSVIKALGGGSVALGSISLTTGSAAAGGTTEIVTIRGEDNKPVKTKEVPTEWYDHLQDIRHARDSLQQEFGDRNWYRGIGYTVTDQWYDGKRGFSISAEATDVSKARNEMPEKHNGNDVAAERFPEPEPMSHCPDSFQNTNTYSCVPGGAYIEGGGKYSGGCQVQFDGNPMYLTCAHGPASNWSLGDCSTDDITGKEITQGASDTPLGTVSEYDYNQDFSVIDPYDDNLDDKVIPEDYSIFGHVSEDGIADHQSTGETIYQYGAKSGERRSGTIRKDFQWSPCYNSSFHHEVSYIRYDDLVPCNGDSGSPYYVIDDILGVGTVIAIASILYGGTEDWNTSRGPSAYDMTNRYPMDFSQQSDLC